MNKNNCYQCYNSNPLTCICDITNLEIKDEGILENDCNNFKPMCCSCEIQESNFVYKDNLYCSECLLDKLEKEEKIETWTVKHYMIDSEYYGNDNDNDMEEVIRDITKRLHIKKIEED